MTLKLDADQQKAVEHFEGPALVVAGPGSGKTTVIKERILNLIQKHGVDPEHILAIAFTNAAADEMDKRLSNIPVLNHSKPKICTLHVFGKELITNHYELLGFSKEPDIWDEKEIEQIIAKEKTRLNIANEEQLIAIYKFESKITGRCYIGQTRNPKRREQEHRTDPSRSNHGLYNAIQNDDEQFDFEVIKWVKGQRADWEEAHQINFYRDRSAINLDQDMEQVEGENPNIPATIYKIKSQTTGTSYIGHSIDPEWSKELHFLRSPNDILRKAIEEEGMDQFTYEILEEDVPWAEAPGRVAREITKYRNLAVFNRQDPLHARDSNRRRIEIFCEHFDVPYEEVIEHTQKFKDLIKKFDTMKEDIVKAKRQVDRDLFKPDEIDNPILRAFTKRYESIKQKADAIDFLDMLILSANMLEKNQDLLHGYRENHRYVFVDEFQDISPVDFRLIKLFPKNLFAVGDDDQAIYGFRGGDSQIMQEQFGKQENVVNYEITLNYRSTSSVVKHARSLILHNNPHRFSKNLRAENPCHSRVEILKTSPDTAEKTLLYELLPIVTVCETHFKENMPYVDNLLLQELTTPQKIGILARNWYEVNPIQTRLNSTLKNKGFQVYGADSDDQEKGKLIMRRGEKEIEINTIHSAKGQEWEKVILLVNTVTYSRKASLPDERNDLEDERRLFYVAVTRAKWELVVLNGGKCRFVSEFQNKRPIEIVETIESQIEKELQEVSQKALETLKLKFKKEEKKELASVLKQSDELNRWRNDTAEVKNASEEMKINLPKQLKATNEIFLKRLIPVLDEFESQINSPSATTEVNTGSNDFEIFTERVRRAHKQLLDVLKKHELKPIEAIGEIFNPIYHEKVSSDIYSHEVKVGRIATEKRRGYLLQGRVVRKAQVIISKKKQQADVFLSQDFAQPVRFVTYAGFRDLRNIETFKDGIKGLNLQGEEEQLQNLNVLFAFPRGDMETLKPYIKIRRHLANRNLQPLEIITERCHLADDTLKSLLVKEETVEPDYQTPTVQFVTRSGHVLNGHLWDFDNDFLYMYINRKVVIVYRAGILDFKNLIWNEITKAYKNNSSINGHIIKQSKSGLWVKFKSLIGFLPASQVELKTVQNLDSYVGKTLKMKVIKINKPRNNIVFSRRAWLEERRTKLFNTFSEASEEPSKLRNIKRISKTVEAIPGTNGFPLVPEAQDIPLDKSTNLIPLEPVEEIIDTPTPMLKDFSEILDPCVQRLKSELLESEETEHAPLYEPIDLIIPEPVKGVVDSRLPMPKDFSEILDSQTQNLKPEILEIEISPSPREVVNNNWQLTAQEREDILKTHIQNLKPAILEPDIVPEPPVAVNNNAQKTLHKYDDILRAQIQNLKPENSDNVTQDPTLETEVDCETPIDSTVLTHSDSPIITDNNTRQIREKNPFEDETENAKKSFGYYLHRGGRFAVEKIKATILKKLNS